MGRTGVAMTTPEVKWCGWDRDLGTRAEVVLGDVSGTLDALC